MKRRVASVVVPLLALTGCAATPANVQTEKLKLALSEVEKLCGATPGTLKLEGDDQVTMDPPSPDAKYETLDCVFRELKKPQFANHIKLGFVGNEAYVAEEQK
ncbi:hypothetical protein [Sphingopyxis sp. RIFCSPHIGHO2_12_FULL_65_19]|uniref:hypothetical protein n=1 Tax=Sphingopyxis sp. RIFCSPHIGHO2_12_FULL_65_19 TaxID=1802172 RepID=UPI0008AC785D|nr:hypothetical protein [Sphingopyxis sp. RIFCSPHIGHO2_12_FULL_65_19]OHD06206.1 MAG: hypothetical protein A3E77_12765 [Sphingopyxis sp. RIFCSPHIGHO2_12_FULL_65_19]